MVRIVGGILKINDGVDEGFSDSEWVSGFEMDKSLGQEVRKGTMFLWRNRFLNNLNWLLCQNLDTKVL
jgi:hypothetical protein